MSTHTRLQRAIGYSLFALQFGLGCIFIYAAVPKIQHPYDFLENVISYRLVNAKLAVLTAAILPWLELMVGIALVTRMVRPASMPIAVALLGLFVFVQASALARGLKIGCGCFGDAATESLVSSVTLLRTICMLIGGIIMLFGMHWETNFAQRESHDDRADRLRDGGSVTSTISLGNSIARRGS